MIDVPYDRSGEASPSWRWLETIDCVKHVCFVCPQGHHMLLGYRPDPNGRLHTFHEDGTVNGSVVCVRCVFHENVRLLGWTKDSLTTG